MSPAWVLAWLTIGFALSSETLAFGEGRQIDPEDRSGAWSLGFSHTRHDSIYAGEDYRTDFMPMFSYTGKRFYVDTNELGWHAIDTDQWQLDVFSNYFIEGYNDHSFFSDTGEVRPEDDPLKGMERKSAFEAGFELVRKTNAGRWSLDARHDIDGVHNGGDIRAKWAKVFRMDGLQLEPWAEYRLWSAEKSDYYYGVRESEKTESRPAYELGHSSSFAAGMAARYALHRQHQVSVNLGYRWYSDDIESSPVVVRDGGSMFNFSYRYFADDRRATRSSGDYNFFNNNGNPYSVRVAYGCVTDTTFNRILRGDIHCDGGYGANLATLFLGRQISDSVFSLPIEAWIQGGVARRFENGFQQDFYEGVFAFKALFRQFPWSDVVETRLGFSEGISYADRVPYLEQQDSINKDRRTSHLLNYLEFSLDVSVGDIVGVESLENLYAGFYVHHRSGIFASANLFGNVYGGSNVNMLYLEWEID